MKTNNKNKKHEAMDDVLREYERELENMEKRRLWHPTTSYLRNMLKRVREAWKREKSQSWHHREMEELILRHEKEVAELKNQLSNSAEIRKALELCVKEMCNYCRNEAIARGLELTCADGCESYKIAKAALSATAAEQEGKGDGNGK